VTIQDLGSIGELVAAIATLATLIYLATQVRQNTRALKSATFQNISGEMGKNVELIVTNADLAAIMVKGNADPTSLTAEERLRYSSMLVASFRRLESVYVQHKLGSIDEELKEGFEISLMSVLKIPFGEQWWASAKAAFYQPFSDHVDLRLASGEIPRTHPSLMLEE
jgi:hypothetical protein